MARPSATAASAEKLGQPTAASSTTSATIASTASSIASAATASSAEQLTEVETLGECLT
jgi:hypothetical protein